jgi:hypothetical protein
MFKPLATAYLT